MPESQFALRPFLFGSQDLAWSELGSLLLSMRLCH